MSQLLKSYVKPASVLLNKCVLSSYLEKYTLNTWKAEFKCGLLGLRRDLH